MCTAGDRLGYKQRTCSRDRLGCSWPSWPPKASRRPRSPLDLGVTEETGTSLSQIDVTLTGPADALARVGPDSFHLWVGGRKVDRVLADGVCSRRSLRGNGHGPRGIAAEPRGPGDPPTTWLLYFDQPHLTQSGRARAIQLARDALPQILGKGDRATIVSNGRGTWSPCRR